MTLVTGLVDAFSYLVLGHVFVANMTGNVVFLGFATAGAPGFSDHAPRWWPRLAFAAGALIGGWLGARHRDHRGRLHSVRRRVPGGVPGRRGDPGRRSGDPGDAGYRYALIIALGVSMGIQNASARKLAVPDLTTTVLTLTITGIAADSKLAGGAGSKSGRRLLSVVTMLAGAVVGAALIRHAQAWWPLLIALAVLIVGAAADLPDGKVWTLPGYGHRAGRPGSVRKNSPPLKAALR